jgi:hypothetical protein
MAISNVGQVFLVLMATFVPTIIAGLVIYKKTGNKAMLFSIVMTWLYLMLPIPIIMYLKDLNAIEAVYWGMQTITTVGYGDVTMNTDTLKLFVTCYSPIGMMIMFLWKRLLFEYAYSGAATDKISWTSLIKPFLILFFIVCCNAMYWGPRFNSGVDTKGQWVINGFYFTINTISTTGYGDFLPKGPSDYFVWIVTIVLGIPAWFYFIGKCVAFLLDRMIKIAVVVKRATLRLTARLSSFNRSSSKLMKDEIARDESFEDEVVPAVQPGPKPSDLAREAAENAPSLVPSGAFVVKTPSGKPSDRNADEVVTQSTQSLTGFGSGGVTQQKSHVSEEEVAGILGGNAGANVFKMPSIDATLHEIHGQVKMAEPQKPKVTSKDPVERAWTELHHKWLSLLHRAEKVGPRVGDEVIYGSYNKCVVKAINNDGSVVVRIPGLTEETVAAGGYEWSVEMQGYKQGYFPSLPKDFGSTVVAVSI